ncbi:MAG: ribokinase [Bacillota bacterium]|nr:ribokinase [Bacillota bacterium]
MKKILVIGSLNMDIITKVKKTPKVGETILGEGLINVPGGKGANQSVALGKLGVDVKHVGKVGNDNFGEVLRNNLKKNNVDINYVRTDKKEPTGTALIMLNENGNNSIVVIPGANFKLKKEDIDEDMIKSSDILLSQFETPMETIEKSFEIGRRNGIYTVLNPAPARRIKNELLKNVDLLIPNETEFEVLTGIKIDNVDDVVKGSKELLKNGVKEIIVTMGEDGVVHINKNGFKKYSAYNVKAIDTTAAGDSFIGGLLSRIALDETIEKSIEYAIKVSALTVMKIGAQSSLPSLEEVSRFDGLKR